MEDKTKILVICGPTASGKTGLSIEIAQKFNGEIISADSMQVYKNLNIGTAKATKAEQEAVPHHLVDFLQPEQPYNVQIFIDCAKAAIAEITSKGKLPIIVGGTGLYIESLINGIIFTYQDENKQVKEQLNKELQEYGNEHMYELLCEIDPQYAKTVHKNNYVRVLRAIEIYRLTGKRMSEQLVNSRPQEKPYNSLLIGLNYTDRQSLYGNINFRVDYMMYHGIIEEAEYVYKNKDAFITSASAIGYKEFFPYFKGENTLEECAEKLKQASRNYAKRQLTWFNRMSDINWFMIEDESYKQRACELTKKFITGNL
ncbi:MAG: tRNA (adenosine(37)-N6)-dimethylallyltransferase MiaA [Oscillospiraceae bacterium]